MPVLVNGVVVPEHWIRQVPLRVLMLIEAKKLPDSPGFSGKIPSR